MKTLLATVAIILLLPLMPTPVAAQPCPSPVNLCTVLANGGFSQGLQFWDCSEPNNNYRCQPEQNAPTPNVPASAIPGPDGPFIGVLNPNDEDIAGKVVHDPQLRSPVDPVGTCYQAHLTVNRGRLSDPTKLFTGAAPTVHVRIQGWRPLTPPPGPTPVLDPEEDVWSRRPTAMNCQLPFTNYAAPGFWSGIQTLQCFATQPVAYVSLSISGVNHSHDSYVAFDCDTD